MLMKSTTEVTHGPVIDECVVKVYSQTAVGYVGSLHHVRADSSVH